MKSKYFWKVLSEDGLLKEPVYKSRFGYEDNLNGYYGGYDTEFEAQQAVTEAKQDASPWNFPRELILIKVFDVPVE